MGGGNGITSDELTATAADVLKGMLYMGADTDDEVGTGTLELKGNAAVGDVIKGKQFYNTNPKSIQTGTLELTGNATAGDVLNGKTFYSNNPKSRQTGTLALSGNATAARVLSGYTFYATDPKTRLTGTIPSYSGRTITPRTTNQTIAAGNYLSGNVTIAGDADLVAGNIKQGKNIFGVNGTCKEAAIVTKTVAYSGSSYVLYDASGNRGYFYRLVIGAIDITPCLIVALCGRAATIMYPNINGLSNLGFNAAAETYGGNYPDSSLGSNKSQFSVSKSNIVIPVLTTGGSDHTYFVDIMGYK